MQYCESCGNTFYESQGCRDDYTGAYECPYCGEQEDITEMAVCRACRADYLAEGIDGGLCPDCAEAVRKAFRAFWAGLTPAARNYILETDYHPADEEVLKNENHVPAA